MLKRYQAPRLIAAAALLGSLASFTPAFAADDAAAPATAPAMHMEHKHHHTPADMQKQVETRIATLHAKLMITPDQETAWSGVTQAMRDNETAVSTLISQRHQNAKTMTAVQDMESYQAIAQAHADGLKKVITAFSPLYDSMSDEQKANADKIFSGYEGHDHDGHAMKPETK